MKMTKHVVSVQELIAAERANSGPPRQTNCCRCDLPTENPPNAAASINGIGINDCPLCVECRVLCVVDRREFVEFGWLRYGGTQPAKNAQGDSCE